jgi:hypothetical protein
VGKTEEYARHAQQCERMAAMTKSEPEKRSWLRVAKGWKKLRDQGNIMQRPKDYWSGSRIDLNNRC